MPAEAPPPPYRREVFSHWANLLFLTGAGIAGLYDPNLWLLALPAEAAILWIVPDFKPFRAWVEGRHAVAELARERAWYLEQLWGLKPLPAKGVIDRVKSLFLEDPPDNPDERVIGRASPEFQAYLEMRAIVDRLRELRGVRGVQLSAVDVARCEQVINGYLRLLLACRPLEKAVAAGDIARVQKELAQVERQCEDAQGPLRVALAERLTLLRQQAERLPKLEATLALFRARAESIVQQLRNIHGQVLADPGMDIHGLLDRVAERQDLLVDPLLDAGADRAVEAFLARPEVEARVDARRSRQVN